MRNALHITIAEAIERATHPERFTRPGTAVNAVSVRAHANTPRTWCLEPHTDEQSLAALLHLASRLAEYQRDVLRLATNVAQRMTNARANTTPVEPTHLKAGFGVACGTARGPFPLRSDRLGQVNCTACRDVVR